MQVLTLIDCASVSVRERGRETERQRQRDRDRERQRDKKLLNYLATTKTDSKLIKSCYNISLINT